MVPVRLRWQSSCLLLVRQPEWSERNRLIALKGGVSCPFLLEIAILLAIFVAATTLVWLQPNHYLPWQSAWQDGFAISIFGFALLICQYKGLLTRIWFTFLALALTSVLLQLAVGKIFFDGEGLPIVLYLLAFGLASLAGSTLRQPAAAERAASVAPLALGVVVVAIVSVGLALVQWTGALNLGIWMAEMPPGGRPFGNVAQPNHLCTICFLGLCNLALLRQRRQIGATGFWLAALWLAFGMVMTSSRTGWMQMSFLLAMVAFIGKRNGVWMPFKSMLLLIGLYALLVWFWPTLNEWTLLAEGAPAKTLCRAARASSTGWLCWTPSAESRCGVMAGNRSAWPRSAWRMPIPSSANTSNTATTSCST